MYQVFFSIIAGDHSRLKEDAVPSVFNFQHTGTSSIDQTEESPRAKRFKSQSNKPSNDSASFNVQYETEVETSSPDTNEKLLEDKVNMNTLLQDQGIQCNIPTFGQFYGR